MQAKIREVTIAESPAVDHLDLQVHAFSEAMTLPSVEGVQDPFLPVGEGLEKDTVGKLDPKRSLRRLTK